MTLTENVAASSLTICFMAVLQAVLQTEIQSEFRFCFLGSLFLPWGGSGRGGFWCGGQHLFRTQVRKHFFTKPNI